MSAKRTSKVVVMQPIEVVWNIITNTEKFHGLKLPGTYSSFDRDNASKGTQFKYAPLVSGGGPYERYIVQWEPPEIFSFGHSPNEWVYKYQLIEGGKATEVIFSRKFNSFFGLANIFFILKRIFGASDEFRELTDATTKSLKVACDRISAGEDDGIFVHKWD